MNTYPLKGTILINVKTNFFIIERLLFINIIIKNMKIFYWIEFYTYLTFFFLKKRNK